MLLKVLPEFKALSALIGSGLQKEEITVDIRVMEGPGVYFLGTIDGLSIGLWLPEQEWASWLESTVSVVDTHCVHPHLFRDIPLGLVCFTPCISSADIEPGSASSSQFNKALCYFLHLQGRTTNI